MKKIFAILLATIITSGTLATALAAETVRPSISISAPSSKLVNSDIRFTISLSSAYEGEEIMFNPSLIEAIGFTYSDFEIIQINKNIYDVVYHNVTSSGIGKIRCLKGCGLLVKENSETIQTPESISFFLYHPATTRKEIADYLLKLISDEENPSDYNLLKSSGLMIGDENGELNLNDTLTEDEAYILNRRIEMMNK